MHTIRIPQVRCLLVITEGYFKIALHPASHCIITGQADTAIRNFRVIFVPPLVVLHSRIVILQHFAACTKQLIQLPACVNRLCALQQLAHLLMRYTGLLPMPAIYTGQIETAPRIPGIHRFPVILRRQFPIGKSRKSGGIQHTQHSVGSPGGHRLHAKQPLLHFQSIVILTTASQSP